MSSAIRRLWSKLWGVRYDMTPEEVQIVRDDWKTVLTIADVAATLFYKKLFEMDPEVRTLFRDDLTEQKKKLITMLTFITTKLDNPNTLEPIVHRLGRRHVHYGVKIEHYHTVGAALISTLKQGLGDSFDSVHEAAWVKAYGMLVQWMT
jgi:methyl-accepting chemotaxis protein